MWEYMEERARMCAEYILATGTTVRGCAAHFNISKSTVHKDITERLAEIDVELCEKVRRVLDLNLAERHIRGGNATRKKYAEKG
ncbi:MAG TPA: sporulation transcriptional regulator SpoIIID [Candidatus Borkfalkia excrementigallinarum]|uniref:Sporulation transcriptional regulator SpoIIID n=1 Tax=Candidatus Borkfalkia excrementigallinarum TaxID=2838506 RepID=A0A9D2CRN1_9FIRM|nr:sporulation transcriptional regulator SpoIIID [Candidatus Borkfalkia excrementigallinarum]